MSLYKTGADGLDVGNYGVAELEAQADDDFEAATRNTTDLRRARQRARGVIKRLQDAIQVFLAERGIDLLNRQGGPRQINEQITRLSRRSLRDELVSWLNDRRTTTMGRAARAAFDLMQRELPSADREDFVGQPQFTNFDRRTANLLRQIDVGLFYDTEAAEQLGLDQPLAERVGDRITRQLRTGHGRGETVQELARRIELVMTAGSREAGSERVEKGVSGQTIETKAQMMAHDSVQDAYVTEAQKRYLQNGFRFVVYDATCDLKTSDLCIRLGECSGDPVVIDLLETPFLVPPNHPHCRSGIRPVLDPPRDPVGEDDIADGFLQTIFQTSSFRPPVVGEDDFQPTPLTRQMGQA